MTVQIKSNQIKSNQIKSNQIKSNQIKSNQIKSNQEYFQAHSIQSIELTKEGDLSIEYNRGGQKTVKNGDIPTELVKVKENMEKNGIKKLTKEDLARQLRDLETERNNSNSEE